jgi:predicted ABC-type ATPase
LRDLVAATTDVLIDPDRIAREINPSAPRSADLAAGRRAIRLFNDAVEQARSISLETTLSGRAFSNG